MKSLVPDLSEKIMACMLSAKLTIDKCLCGHKYC